MIQNREIPLNTAQKILAFLCVKMRHLYYGKLRRLSLKQIGIGSACIIVLLGGAILLWPADIPVPPQEVVEILCTPESPEDVQSDDHRSLSQLIQRIAGGGNVNATDKQGNTALILAAKTHNRAALCWLIAKGADVSRTNKAGYKAADYATNKRIIDLLETCEQDKAPLAEIKQASYRMWTEEYLSMCLGEFSVLPFAQCSDRIKAGGNPTRMAAQMIDASGYTPEYLAYFMRHGADIAEAVILHDSNSIFLLEEVDKCLKAQGIHLDGVDVHVSKSSASAQKNADRAPLFQAIEALDVQRVRELISQGADVNQRDKQDYTPLLLAIDHCTEGVDDAGPEIVRLLLEAKADSEASRKDHRGNQNAFTLLACNAGIFATQPNYATRHAPKLEKTLQTLLDAKVRVVPHVLILLPVGNQDKPLSPALAKFATMLLDAGANPLHRSLNGAGVTSLMTAGSCDAALAQRLIDAGVKVNDTTTDGWTALHSAQTPEVAATLLKAGANPNAMTKGNSSRSPLLAIIAKASVELLPELTQALLKGGAEIQGKTDTGKEWSAMKETARREMPFKTFREMAGILTKAGADINQAWGSDYPAELLISLGAEVKKDMLLDVIYARDAKALVRAGADINARNDQQETPLIQLVKNVERSWMRGQWDIPKILSLYLELGADPDLTDAKGHTAMYYANNRVLYSMLVNGIKPLDPQKNVNDLLEMLNSISSIRAVTDEMCEECLDILLRKHGTQVPADIFFQANPTFCSEPIFDLLVKAGADVHAKNSDGYTALIYIGVCNANITRKILRAGVDPNACNKYGDTALHHAGDAEVAKALIEAGADVNAKNQRGETPLHTAKNEEIANALLEAGADLEAVDQKGLTPLRSRMRLGKALTLHLLAKGAEVKGSNWDICEDFAATPMYNTSAEERKDIMRAFKDAGADVNRAWYTHESFRSNLTVQEMIDLGAAPLWRDAQGNTTLILRPKDVEKLCQLGVNINAVNHRGNTALMEYVKKVLESRSNIPTSLIDTYIRLGADFSIRNKEGLSLLDIVRRGKYDNARKLESYLTERGISDWTPPSAADLLCPIGERSQAKPEQKQTERWLYDGIQFIEKGGDINGSGPRKQTALMQAAQLNNRPAVAWLIAKGADVSIKNLEGKTAYDMTSSIAVRELLSICAKENEPLTDEEKEDLQKRADSPEALQKALFEYGQYVEKLSTLLKAGADPTKPGQDGSLLLEQNLPLESVAYLLRRGYDVGTLRADGKLPLRSIVPGIRTSDMDPDIIRLLVASGMKIDRKDQNTALSVIICCDDVKEVQNMLRQNPQLIKATTPAGAPLLSLAPSADMVRALVAAGANAKDKALFWFFVSRKGAAPVMEALRQAGAKLPEIDKNRKGATSILHNVKDAAALQVLIKAQGNVNERDFFDSTPLHAAAIERRADVVEELLKNGADVNAKRRDGATPLDIAVMQKSHFSRIGSWVSASYNPETRENLEAEANLPRILDLLLQAGAQTNDQIWYNIVKKYWCSDLNNDYLPSEQREETNKQLILTLIKHHVPVPKDILSRIPSSHYIEPPAQARCDWLANTLLDAGADPKAVHQDSECGAVSALFTVGKYNAGIIKRLIAGGADPNLKNKLGITALHEVRTLEALNALVEAGADIHAYADNVPYPYRGEPICTIVANASETEAIPMVKRLLELGAKVHSDSDAQAKWDVFTGLCLNQELSDSVFLELGNIFRAAGADPRTAMDAWSFLSRIKLFAKLGMDFSREGDDNGGTILHSQKMRHTKESIRHVLELGIDINAVDNDGNTALMKTASSSVTHYAKLLLDEGARTDIKNKKGETALDIARKSKRVQMIKLLEKHK